MTSFEIAGRPIGPGHPVYVIAEISANHNQRFDAAAALVQAAAAAGADAVKLQTYRPDSITLDSDQPAFRVGEGTLWSGRTLHDLYVEAQTPWEWQPRLAEIAADAGITLFSSPFDREAVAFLDDMGVPAYKIASFELIDLDLVAAAAGTGKPVILSTGMATADEIDAAVRTATGAGAPGVALLRCNSAYPASPGEMDLLTIPDMIERWGIPVGLSDHTLGLAATLTAVALGAVIVEKHITGARADGGPDAAFSLQPDEFATMVREVRDATAALGTVRYGPSPSEVPSTAFRRSLFAVADIAAGEVFTAGNVRSIRPAGGLPPSRLPDVIGRRAARDIERGTPLTADLVDQSGV